MIPSDGSNAKIRTETAICGGFNSCVLYLAGEDEQSTEMAARWEDEKVTEAASDGFVVIKINTKRFEPILILSLIQSFIDDDESKRLLKSSP